MGDEPGMIERLAGLAENAELSEALAARRTVLAYSEAARIAVLAPRAPGGLSHGLRAALAVRMARLNADAALAEAYGAQMADGDDEFAAVAEPGAPPPADPRLGAIVRHADLLTLRPRDAGAADIAALVEAGMDEPDIVRLAELAAFVNYQVRVIAGLKLMGAAS